MIRGELEVVERDGRQILVDENGDELVCRKETGLQSGGSRIYHRVDVSHYNDEGVGQPNCGRVTNSTLTEWILRRRKTIEPNWDSCSYSDCYGEYDPSNPKPESKGHPQSGLATQLNNMSVDEFDAAVGGDG